MEISRDLIKRFFDKQCTKQEADFVAKYLEQHPGAMDEYFNQQEFEETEAEELSQRDAWERWDELQERLKVRRLSSNIQRLAIAASVVGIVVLGALFFNNSKEDRRLARQEQVPSKPDAVSLTRIANNSDLPRRYTLKDGSEVKLSAKAAIAFNENEWQTRRDIDLKGEAVFYVAKDKDRPFTVYCSEVSVRALGTTFSVRQQQGADSMRVRLFEGKVLVRKQHEPAGKDTADLIKPINLQPGQEVVFTTGSNIASVRSFLKTNPAAKPVAKNKPQTTGTAPVSPGWVEFSNQPLTDLFGSIEVLYNVEIDFRRQDVRNIYFMGRFEPYDTIDGILEIIGRLNGLKIIKVAPGKYRVRKI